MENFWPNINTEKVDDPLSIISTQGDFLEQHSQGILSYKILRKPFEDKNSPSGQAMRLDFYIRAPHFDNYQFMLFYVVHDLIMPYPSHISYFSDKIIHKVKNKIEFEVELKRILNDPNTASILESLLSQSDKSAVLKTSEQ